MSREVIGVIGALGLYPFFVALIGGIITYYLTSFYVLCLLWQKDWKCSAIVVALLAGVFSLYEPLLKAHDYGLVVLMFFGYLAWIVAIIVCWPTRQNIWCRWALNLPLVSGVIGFASLIVSSLMFLTLIILNQ